MPGLRGTLQPEIPFTDAAHVVAQSFPLYPVIVSGNEGFRLQAMEWGIIADYMNTPAKVSSQRSWMCNARSEKILDKKSYWYRIRSGRCLIPATGIFEHREVRGIKNKIPYLVRIRERKLFALPGLQTLSRIIDPGTGELISRNTFTLITRTANSLMAQIHNGGPNKARMPLFLTPELEQEWLSPGLTEEPMQRILGYEIPAEDLEYWPVWSIRTSKPHPLGGSKTDPYAWKDLPRLGDRDPA
ncbi:MAG TPA: SOS response-associated peptidase family protein [Chitinophagaceae bacterium]|nr:SOS response-associated peptidase family protein [Chitinophagaceae bacterium]